MKSLARILGVVLFAYLFVMAVMTVQYFFDRGDMRKASQVIFEFRPQGSNHPTLLETMASLSQVKKEDVNCQTTLASRYEGLVDVDCKAGTESFLWEIDVVAGRVIPKNDNASRIVP